MVSRIPWQQEELRRVLSGRMIAEPGITYGPGTEVRLMSGTEGWIRGTIVEYFDVKSFPPLHAAVYGGGVAPGYKVKILEGKHKGETISVPVNYVEPVGGGESTAQPKKPHTPSPWR